MNDENDIASEEEMQAFVKTMIDDANDYFVANPAVRQVVITVSEKRMILALLKNKENPPSKLLFTLTNKVLH